jgi:hypothetical protein
MLITYQVLLINLWSLYPLIKTMQKNCFNSATNTQIVCNSTNLLKLFIDTFLCKLSYIYFFISTDSTCSQLQGAQDIAFLDISSVEDCPYLALQFFLGHSEFYSYVFHVIQLTSV